MKSKIWVALFLFQEPSGTFGEGEKKERKIIRDILICSESTAKFFLLSHSNKFSLSAALCELSLTTT